MSKRASVIWEDPPPKKHRSGTVQVNWDEIIDIVSARPGHWARVKVYETPAAASSAASYIKRQYEGLETRTVSLKTGKARLYVRLGDV